MVWPAWRLPWCCSVQDCSNSIANALELLQSCTEPSLCSVRCLLCDCSNSTANTLELLQSCTEPLSAVCCVWCAWPDCCLGATSPHPLACQQPGPALHATHQPSLPGRQPSNTRTSHTSAPQSPQIRKQHHQITWLTQQILILPSEPIRWPLYWIHPRSSSMTTHATSHRSHWYQDQMKDDHHSYFAWFIAHNSMPFRLHNIRFH